jgi:precorrin-6A/cobalt-precorrin-6A reductase
MVVTKASGTAGGEDIKHQIAAELGVKLIVIDRPSIAYPQQTSDLQTALAFCLAFCQAVDCHTTGSHTPLD